MNWYLDVIKNKYFNFDGRARRQEYWMFTLFNIIAIVILAIIDSFFGKPILQGLYTLAIILPSLGVTVRRLHDTGRSGWWILIAFVPFIGGLILLVFTILDSQPGDNQYGANPKGA
ncbi:MAG: DUF805 domain-containing protein [Lysobacter sp.]|nr:MAG: DUF805 domain-containing protein [Lysobacter sp.]